MPTAPLTETSPIRPAFCDQISQPFVNALFSDLGGTPLGGAEEHRGTHLPLLSHRIEDYLVDFRTLVHDPKNILELYERAEAFAADRRERGSIQDALKTPGEATRAYWKKYLSTAISQELDRAAAHVRYCRAYLYQPHLQGIVFFVNQSIPLVEPSHLEIILAGAQARHAGAVALCVYHCRIPGAGPLQGVVPQDSTHAEFGMKCLDKLNEHLTRTRHGGR